MPSAATNGNLTRVLSSVVGNDKLPVPITNVLGRMLLLDRLQQLYDQVMSADGDGPLFERLLRILAVEPVVTNIQRIPRSGPVVLVANHPFGVIEGCLLAALLPRVRPDVKIMANSLLSVFGGLSEHFVFVNPFGGEEANRENRRGLREAFELLRSGGMLAVFPAGEVAHLDLRERAVVDPPWSRTVARLARMGNATVIPTFFSGANSPLFHLLGLIHPRLRTAMLPHEFLNKQHQRIEMRVGTPIPAQRLERFATDDEAIDYMRKRTYLLAHRGIPARPQAPWTPILRRQERLIAPVEAGELAAEIERLPARRHLLSMGDMTAYCAPMYEIPGVLREIGRLRELTFRQAGEGTGKSLDLDSFDAHYTHLFVWDTSQRQIVGSYRLGQTDRICSMFGVKGLYTSTLFRYDERFLNRIGTGLELGRSFVRPEHQKSYAPLLLLWKGIGTYLCRNPRYHVLFGPVSISAAYEWLSRQMMVSYFQSRDCEPDLAPLIKARSPFRRKAWQRHEGFDVWDIEELSGVVADIETDQKGVPVLLRQYLRLGGKVVGFNVDRQFSNALDGLIVVDLRQTDRKVLERYLGREGAQSFLDTSAKPR